MKRILSLILMTLFLFVSATALADSETINLLVSLMSSQLPAEDDDMKVELYYDSSADAVVLNWTMKFVDSETYFAYASLLQKQTSALFDSVASVTGSMKNLLETADCSQSALGIVTTDDAVPVAVFLNGSTICIAD